MKFTAYTAHEIRGSLGDMAPMAYQDANHQKAIQWANKLRERFPDINWLCPHENLIVNQLYKMGRVKGDDIVQSECELIAGPDIQAVVVLGQYYAGTGVAKEIVAAHDADKLLWFMDDQSEESFQTLANDMSKDGVWEILEGK